MKKMSKIVGIITIFLFVVAFVPSAGFCQSDRAASTAGAAGGADLFAGVTVGQVVAGAVVVSAAIAIIALSLGGHDATTPTHTTTAHH